MIYCRIGTSGLRKHQKNIKAIVDWDNWDCTVGIAIDSIIDISHLMLAINSSVNVIIYTLRGTVTFLVTRDPSYFIYYVIKIRGIATKNSFYEILG